jgi:predicted ATP-dependent endonuclease of OLD family
MFISKLFVQNFRSLRQATIRFEKGKNVIVGKNNYGKSNIVKAIEVLIGVEVNIQKCQQ